MIKLVAVYRETSGGRWNAYVSTHQNIRVYDAEDLDTARVILRIITAEELPGHSKRRVDWDFVEERVHYYATTLD